MFKQVVSLCLIVCAMCALPACSGPSDSVDPANASVSGNTSNDESAEPVTTAAPPVKYTAVYLGDNAPFKVYAIKPGDFLDTELSFNRETLYKNMTEELAHLNRIRKSEPDVNFFVYLCPRIQDMPYYNDIIPNSICTNDMFNEFIAGAEVDAIGYLDISDMDKRFEKVFKTDHHWTAAGSYEGYTDIIKLMGGVISDIGEPLELKGYIEIPGAELRGSWASRLNYNQFFDTFSVIDVDLPKQHPTERVVSYLDDYLAGKYDKGTYVSHYEKMYSRPAVITYPENKTGRNLLIIGDSYSYWVSWLIGTHFDKTYVYYDVDGKTLEYNKFVRDNKITDVLMLKYSNRIFRGSGIPGFLNLIKTEK